MNESELRRQIDEDLARDVRERRAEPGGSRDVSDEHRRLSHEPVDQCLRVEHEMSM